MAETEHIDILRQGVGVWNLWRQRYPQVEADLRNVNLGGGKDLRAFLLSRADRWIRDTYFVDLEEEFCLRCGSDIKGANLRRADLSGANLIGVNLSGADLINAKLVGANLRAANLSDAILSGADFCDADLADAVSERFDLDPLMFDSSCSGEVNMR